MTGLGFLLLSFISSNAPFSLLLAIVLHEAGHILYALFCGMGLPRIKLFSAGITLSYPSLISNKDSFFLSLSGPIMSLSLFFLFYGTPLSLYSAGLAFINLLPVSCLDGGNMLSSLCDSLLPADSAYRICRFFSLISVFLLCAFNIIIQIKAGFNVTLMAVTLYILVTSLFA